LYWNQVQTAPDGWNWDSYDKVVTDNMRYQLGVDAILLGRPDIPMANWIKGLSEPIFADGSDVSGTDKTVNPDNRGRILCIRQYSATCRAAFWHSGRAGHRA
jgi:hypothetical protein